MPTKHDKEQDKRIAANSEAIERLTEYMHQIRNFHMPWAESPFQTKLRKKFIRPILKISAGVTIGMSVFKGAGVYLERQKLHTMADRYAEVATRLYNDENNPEVALPFLEKAISIDSEQPEYLFTRAYMQGIEGLMVEKGTLPPAPIEGVSFPYASPAPVASGWAVGTKAYYVKNCAADNAWLSTAVEYTDLEGNLKLSNATQPEDEAGQWVVCGTDEEGYQFYNVAAGPTMVLGITGSENTARTKMYKATSVTNDVTTRFDFHENGEGFSFRKHGTESDCFNSRDQYLALWNNSNAFTKDNGSRFVFVEAEDATVGVSSVASETVVDSTYDLSGRMYTTGKLSAGIYLIEGKKRIVK